MKKVYNFVALTILNASSFTLREWKRLCRGRKATLYIVKIFDGTETFIKVGRTCTTLKMRFSHLPYKYTLLYIDRGGPIRIYNLENKLHSKLKSSNFPYRPLKKFSGDTECYAFDAIFLLSELLDFHVIEN